MLKLSQFLQPSMVTDLKATEKLPAIRELVDLMGQSSHSVDWENFYEKNVEREAQSSTAMGLGVAIPHARENTLKEPIIAVGRSRQGIDFGAPDGAPVQLVFLIVVGKDHALYLKVVSRIAWLVRNDGLRHQLFTAESPDALYDALKQY